MPIKILMPALSPTMTEGNVISWHKNAGDLVKAGDILAEIETDKATMEVEAVDEGTLAHILIPAGTQNVKVNSVLAVLLEEGEDPKELDLSSTSSTAQSTVLPQEQAPAVSTLVPSQPAERPSTSRVFASPLARRLSKQNQIDLNGIQGSGPKGRIVKRDIEQRMAQPVLSLSSEQVSLEGGPVFSGFEPAYEEVPLNMMRKVIAKRLTESKQSVPHFYLTVSCEIDALLAARKSLNSIPDVKISVNDLIIRACALTLKQVPQANVAWAGGMMRTYAQADIAVAVAIEGGLITPVVRAADTKGLGLISSQMKDLAGRAREGKLKPEEFQGGTFCLSNLGMYGIQSFSAIINPPQACILAVGAGLQQAVVKNGALAIATVMQATLSVDHRVVDGAVAAQFLKVFKELIEHPARMLL